MMEDTKAPATEMRGRRQPVMPFGTVAFSTTDKALIKALGGSQGPHEATAVRLLGANVVDLEIDVGLPYRVVIQSVPEGGSEEDTGASRWSWPS